MAARNWRLVAWVGLVAIVVWGFYTVVERGWENQIASCESGNPVREGEVLGLQTAATHAKSGNALYQAADKITNQPYVAETGHRNCARALPNPLSLELP